MGARVQQKVVPVSVALDREQRELFEREARRRGLGVSTTIRTLAVERVRDLRAAGQRERAFRWQTEQVRAMADRIEREGFREVSQAEIDAIFDRAEATRRKPRRAPRR